MKASAPGKIILFGEHAVVYGRPALAAPVTQVHADVDVSDSPRPGIWIEAADIGLHAELNALPSEHPLAAAIHNLFAALTIEPFPNLGVTIKSTIPIASGMGSGTAVSVALIRALSLHLKHPLSDEEVSALAFELEKLHHGTPSGIDNTVVTYARPIAFVKGRPIELLKVGKPFTIVIGDTGIPAPTRDSVSDVRRRWEADRSACERLFDEIGNLATRARAAMESGAWPQLGPLMDQNHALLQEISVSSPELDCLVQAARAAGALGAKLSGGGRGGNMIALVTPEMAPSLSEALRKAGAQRVITTIVE